MTSGVRSLWVLYGLVGCTALASTPGPAAEAARADEGARIYTQRCSSCHGENLVNVSGGWSFDLRRLRPDEHDRFVDSVTAGKDNMPSWYGILSSEEIEAIWAYIRATVDK